ncbi:MAG: hypothetical protein ABI863_22275 [Ginsengibacter sp.]
MSKEETKDLLKFLAPFTDEIQEIALWLREFVWDLYPDANELIYDNYNALAFGWSPSGKLGEAFCSVAVYGDQYVHFGFYRGSKIADPEKILLGKGNQYRYIKVKTKKDFPKVYIKKLLKEAYAYSLAKMELAATARPAKKQIVKGTTVTKSSLPVKRRPGIIPAKKK